MTTLRMVRGRAALVGLLGLGLSGLAIGTSTRIAACKPKTGGPALAGTWEVVQVAVDSADQPHWLYRPDDPRLLGRELSIDGERVRFNYRTDDCKPAGWKTRNTSWGQLLAESFRRPESAELPRSPKPSDFGSKLAGSAPVAVQSLKCIRSDPKGPVPWADAWFVLQGRDTLAMRLDGSALLMLARRTAGEKPKASFDCARATSPTEKTLCSQTGLAGLDRSVDAAWQGALERQPGDWSRLHDEQTAWLVTRDRCGTDAACLEEQLLQRIDQLVQE
jgi:uncharacterized protein YecT (DUF1311 family)